MEKFGVEVDEERAKTAASKPAPTCPTCGAALLPVAQSNVPRCPNCGTKPFEKK